MRKPLKIAGSTRRATLLCAIILSVFGYAQAQSTPSGNVPPVATPSPTPKIKPSLEHEFFANILRDQRAIWTSPFHMERNDMRWFVPMSLSAGALLTTDMRTGRALNDNNRTRLRISRD